MQQTPIRVLLVEDNEGDARLVREMVRVAPDLSLHHVDRLAAGIEHLETGTVDVVLLDLSLPDSQGLDTLRSVIQTGCTAPVVILTGHDDEALGREAMRAGAQDYLVKGRVEEQALGRAIRFAIERSQIQAKLRDSERRFAALFEVNPNGLVLAEMSSRTIVQANPAAARLIGLSQTELIGQVCDRFVDSAKGDPWPIPDPGREVNPSEQDLVTADGRRVPILRTIAPVKQGGREYLLESFIDITESKRAEAVRVSLEAQLRAAHKMEVIGNFAGGVTHDVSNLLTVILGCSDFALQKVPEDGSLRNDLLQVQQAAVRAAGLTRRFLAFSQRQMCQPTLLDLNRVISEFQKMLRRLIGEGVTLSLRLAPDLGLTMADPGEIEQVLMNLVLNARDAMQGKGTIAIETSNVEGDDEIAANHAEVTRGRKVLLAVTDSGCGMNRQTRERIFEPFFTTKEHGKGTGLGLSTVQTIVKQGGGGIRVESEPGQGTTFKLSFPRALPTASASPEPAVVVPCPRGSETILVVDDEAPLLRLTERILSAAGYTVLTAASGPEAIQLCEAQGPDLHLVLTDIVMPQMSGPVMVDRMLATRPALRVLYMAGYLLPLHGVLDPAAHFIGKPFKPTDLIQKVRAALDV